MVFLRKIIVEKFKNIGYANLEIEGNYHCFSGENGAGKTSLMDAIYYLSFGKSYFNTIDQFNVNFDESYFNLNGTFEKNNKGYDIFCSYVNGKIKKIKRNGVDYERFSDHLGEFPVIMFTPNDNEIISGGSEERRRFIDTFICQFDKEYLRNLIEYQKALKQRNALLKNLAPKVKPDPHLFDFYDDILSRTGSHIFETRKLFSEKYQPYFSFLYNQISGNKENVAFGYESELGKNDFDVILKKNLEQDIILQRTDHGIHKDDLLFTIEGHPLKRFASQGQQKSYLLSLKMAQFQFFRHEKKLIPILLLDDFLDRLDDKRIQQVVKVLIEEDTIGQVFITDTSSDRIQKAFKKAGQEIRIWQIVNGEIIDNR